MSDAPICDRESELELTFKTTIKLLDCLEKIWSIGGIINGTQFSTWGIVPAGWEDSVLELPGLLNVIQETDRPSIRPVGTPPRLAGRQRSTAHEIVLVFGEMTLGRTKPFRDAIASKFDEGKIVEARKSVYELLTEYNDSSLSDSPWEDVRSFLQKEATETLRYHGQIQRDREQKESHGKPKQQPRKKKAKWKNDQANKRAMELAKADPEFAKHPNVREWAMAIGCSEGLVCDLKFYRKCAEEAGTSRRDKPPAPKVEPLTDIILDSQAVMDDELQRLIGEQESDYEASPLDETGKTPRQHKKI